MTSGRPGGHGEVQRFEGRRLPLDCHVAKRVGGRAADDSNIDGKPAIEQPGVVSPLGDLDDVVHRRFVYFPSLYPWIDEGADPDRRQNPGRAAGDISIKMNQHSLREVVSLDLLVDGQRGEFWHQSIVATDGSLQQAHVAEMVEASVLHVSLPAGPHQR